MRTRSFRFLFWDFVGSSAPSPHRRAWPFSFFAAVRHSFLNFLFRARASSGGREARIRLKSWPKSSMGATPASANASNRAIFVRMCSMVSTLPHRCCTLHPCRPSSIPRRTVSIPCERRPTTPCPTQDGGASRASSPGATLRALPRGT